MVTIHYDGVNIFEEFAVDEHQLHDGSKEPQFFPRELPSEERNRLMALSEAELVDEGWTIESVTRFSGPLVVEEVCTPSSFPLADGDRHALDDVHASSLRHPCRHSHQY